MSIVALVPAYNEAASIANTIESLLDQTYPADRIVVIPNGCSDDTAEIARRYPVTVMELPRLEHRKAEALNLAWNAYARDAEIVITIDADTILPEHAFADWTAELREDPALGGSSSKFTMLDPGLLSRLQKAEFATWTDTSLRRGETNVLAGTGCAISGEALRQVAARDDRDGPWCYRSATEDFELTYRIRQLGYYCRVSPTVRAYTDSMKDVKSLWNQRMKWQVGTIEDLMVFGVNRLTLRDWGQQAMGLLHAALKALWLSVIIGFASLGMLHFILFWWIVPVLFITLDIKRAYRIPHRDHKDMLIACTFFANEFFMWFRAAWFVKSWWDVLVVRKETDRWAAQYAAEWV